MAAIAHPAPHPRQVELRPPLRLVRNAPRPSDAVYRRRRLVAVLVLAGVVLAIAGFVLVLTGTSTSHVSIQTGAASGTRVEDPAAFGASRASPPPQSFYVVQPGDTLWSIAHDLVPAGDVRAEVDRLADLNGTAALQAGQRLRLAGSPGS